MEKEKTTQKQQNEVQENKTETKVQKTNTCNFKSKIACDIYNKAISKGATKEQAIIMISISAHETGYWKSKLFKNNNNFGGICANGGFAKYETYEKGLNAFVNLLLNHYFKKGFNTIEKIGAKYCPVGAKNDPNNVNKYWIPSVKSIYNNYVNQM